MKDNSSFFIKGFTQLASLTFLSRISGFLRDIFIAAFLGAGILSDIFFIAFKLPNLFRRITAEGALTSALLPMYTKLIEKKNKAFAIKFYKIFAIRVFIYLCILTIILQIIMPFIVYVLAPGFSDNSLVVNQIILLTRITIIFMPLISMVALIGVITNVSGRFWPFAFTPIILNFSLIIGCFFIGDFWIIKSMPLSIATVIAGFLQLIFMLIIVKKYNILKSNKVISTDISVKNELKAYIKETWSKFLPAAFGGGILQINLLVDTILASLLGFGSISYLYFADRVAQLPLGIIGIALSTSLLTSLSKSIAINNIKQFSQELVTSLKIGLFFSIPSMFVFINFSDLIISVLFERGNFGFKESIETALALKAYAFGIPAFIILKSCQPAFLAEGNTKTPMYIGIILLISNIFFSLIMMRYFYHAGIALATSISSWIGCFIYIRILIKNGKILKPKLTYSHNTLNFFSVFIYFIKITLISIFMIFIMNYSLYFLEIYHINKFWTLLILIMIGLLTYLLTSSLLSYIPQELLNNNYFKFKKD
ncbi:murein biosynthesis integral membrane protein MurJ [Alphaproteobacteria bacterium]|nr:murein biosynthesis integral membrane protein MurJ [Alphaproteobacteria bacterium]